jgi:hypothetical protein
MTAPEDERIESFLRQFRPRRPPPLPATRASRLWLRIAAAAAVLVFAVLITLPFLSREDRSGVRVERPDLTAARLSQLADWDIGRLEQALSEASPRMLPDVERPESVLHALARP